MEILYLEGALMEHFLEGIAPLRYWYIFPNEKRNKYRSAYNELNDWAKPPFMFCRRSAFNEVND